MRPFMKQCFWLMSVQTNAYSQIQRGLMGSRKGKSVPHPTGSSNDRGNTAGSPATNTLHPVLRTCSRLHKATETSKNSQELTQPNSQSVSSHICIPLHSACKSPFQRNRQSWIRGAESSIFPLHWGLPMINASANLGLCWPFQLFKQLCVESISSLSWIFDGLRMSGRQAAYVTILAPDYDPKKERTRGLDTHDRGHSAWQELSAVSQVQA